MKNSRVLKTILLISGIAAAVGGALLFMPVAFHATSGVLLGDDVPPERRARSPLETVNLRMEAYNNHDMESFLSTYSDSVRIFTYPDKKLAGGKEHLRSIFDAMFEEKSVSVELHHQITKDGYVINHETVTYDGSKTEYVSIYEVRDGLITSVRFVRD